MEFRNIYQNFPEFCKMCQIFPKILQNNAKICQILEIQLAKSVDLEKRWKMSPLSLSSASIAPRSGPFHAASATIVRWSAGSPASLLHSAPERNSHDHEGQRKSRRPRAPPICSTKRSQCSWINQDHYFQKVRVQLLYRLWLSLEATTSMSTKTTWPVPHRIR